MKHASVAKGKFLNILTDQALGKSKPMEITARRSPARQHGEGVPLASE